MRITNAMISAQVLANLQRNVQSLARLQDVMSTGRQFTYPDQNPLAYIESLNLREVISENRRFQRNIARGMTNLQVAESTLASINERTQRLREITVQAINGTLSTSSRVAVAQEIDQILQEIIQQSNSSFEGTFIFSGDKTQSAAFREYSFQSGKTGVLYQGDFGERLMAIGVGSNLPVNLTGPQAFFSSLNEITSSVSITTTATPLAPQVAGLQPPLSPAAGTFYIDDNAITFDPATDSLESIRDTINRTITTADARIGADGKLIIRSLTSENVKLRNGTSNVLEVLGMFHRVEGSSIGAGITAATTLAALGISGDALRIKVGKDEYEVNLANAVTVGDVLTAINSSGAPVDAFINAAGTGLSISATESVDSLEIENVRKIFASSALAPGSVTLTTTLASLGITTGPLNITVEGAATTVDLSSATTIEQVINSINTQVNGVRASINANGTGIDLEVLFPATSISAADGGASTIATTLGFAQTRNNNSATDLGIAQEGTVTSTDSRNLFYTIGTLSEELKKDNFDLTKVNDLLNRLDEDISLITQNRAVLGSRINRMEANNERYASYETFLIGLLSTNEDADLADAVTQLATQTNILNASLESAQRVLLPSLIDFLR